MARISKSDVLEAFGEVCMALTDYSNQIDREVELIVRADGVAELMGAEGTLADGPATGFERIEAFDSFSDLWAFLQLAGAA